MSQTGTFVVAEERIVHEPWNVNTFAVVRFKTMMENGSLVRLGYVVANTESVKSLDDGDIQEMAFCLKAEEPLVCCHLQGELLADEPSFNKNTGGLSCREPFCFQTAFSYEHKMVLHEMAMSVHDSWILSSPGIPYGAFNLNMLPMMDRVETAGVPLFHYLDDDSWVAISDELCEWGVPFWAYWMSAVGTRVDEALEVCADAGQVSTTYVH